MHGVAWSGHAMFATHALATDCKCVDRAALVLDTVQCCMHVIVVRQAQSLPAVQRSCAQPFHCYHQRLRRQHAHIKAGGHMSTQEHTPRRFDASFTLDHHMQTGHTIALQHTTDTSTAQRNEQCP
jgi:hypothetical protein